MSQPLDEHQLITIISSQVARTIVTECKVNGLMPFHMLAIVEEVTVSTVIAATEPEGIQRVMDAICESLQQRAQQLKLINQPTQGNG